MTTIMPFTDQLALPGCTRGTPAGPGIHLPHEVGSKPRPSYDRQRDIQIDGQPNRTTYIAINVHP
jgi:hypothetical protein